MLLMLKNKTALNKVLIQIFSYNVYSLSINILPKAPYDKKKDIKIPSIIFHVDAIKCIKYAYYIKNISYKKLIRLKTKFKEF